MRIRFSFMLIFLVYLVLAILPSAAAIDPGHSAAAVGPGTFAAGNFVFQGKVDATTFMGNLNATQICIGSSCQTSWPSGGGGAGWTNTSTQTTTTLNVGIGTTSPTSQLEVAGDLKLNPPYYTVFVTSTVYYGNFGGLSGADSICQARAATAGLNNPTSYKAWLSTTSISASSRLYHSNVPYKRVDGAVVANNWTDLTDGTIQNSINITEYGTYETWNAIVFTGTSADGTIQTGGTGLCSDWTSTNFNGVGGLLNSKTSTWSYYGIQDCYSGDGQSLYCFEQPLNTFYVNSTSNKVGIGTSSPTHTLNVVGNANITGTMIGNLNATQICIGTSCQTSWPSGGGWTNTSTTTYTSLNVNITSGNLTIPNGNFGIGTSSPTHTLNVVGNANITGNNIVQGNITAVNYIKFTKISGACDLTINGSICSNATGTYLVG